jgi:glycosyltransferase involved in cell wall biosynthesis
LQFEYYSGTRPSGYELFSDGSNSHKNELIEQIPTGDIYHLHWIVRFIDYQTFFSNAAKFYPIVWTLHDMNAFTGGCHYDHGCGKYKTGCGKCPQLGSSFQNDLSSFVWHNKQEFFNNLDAKYLHLVTPSQWLGDQCRQSPLLKKFSLTVIQNGLDISEFAPRDRVFSRDVLGIPQDSDTLLFVAESVDNRRKGFKLLIDALSGISNTHKLYLVTIGNLQTNLKSQFPNTILGPLNNDRLLSLIYSAADLYIIPSIQDNLPNTVIESLSCGTPVIGFDVGGIREMIQEGINGFLVSAKDVDALRCKIIETLSNKENLEKMARNCRKSAIKNYAIVKQAKKYLDLYKLLLNKR